MNVAAALGLPAHLLDRVDRACADLCSWARFYRSIGLTKTLPVAAGAKHPSVPWQPYVETDPTEAELDVWFAPGTAAGVCAVLDGSDYVVLDADGAPEAVKALLDQHGIVIPHATGTVESGSGKSVHYWFKASRPIGRRIALVTLDGRTAKQGGAQLDVLDRGVVMLPPSLHPDTQQAYVWRPPIVDPARAPELPAGVRRLLDQPPTQLRLAPAPESAAIPGGRRERDLCRLLGAARRQGATERELQALADATNARCQPPLTARDLDRIAHSIASYPVEPPIDFDALFANVSKERGVPQVLFQTPSQLAAASARMDYVVEPYLVVGAITDLIARAKEGKTRFRNYLISCAIRGACCLGSPPASATPVVLLTEEPLVSLREGLAAAGLLETDDLHILTLFAARDLDWAAMVDAARERAHTIGARLLIVDTVPALARLEGDSENSAGHNIAALRPLQEAAGSGLAVLTVRHDRKAGGVLVDRGRGSSAWAGGCDVLIGLSRPKGASSTTRRLEAIGRFDRIPG